MGDKNRENPSKRVTFSAETSCNEQVRPAKKNSNPRFSSLRYNCDLSTANQSTPVKATSAASLGIVSQSDLSRANQQVRPLTQFFLFPFCENSLICLEGKSMTPHRGNTILFRSYQQLPRLRLRPSTRLV